MATELVVCECGCTACRVGEHPEPDEPQRRWMAGREALRLERGGFQRVAEITGMHPDAIRRGRDEIKGELRTRPAGRIRLPGGGRPRVEKKIRL